MQGYVKLILPALILLFASVISGQTRSDLEKKRQSLEKQIRETQGLIQQSRKKKDATVSNLQTLRSEITMREELVQSLKEELGMLTTEARKHEKSLGALQKTMDDLRSNHAIQLRNAYLEKHMSHPILYLLSAQTLNEAFLRWIYLRQIREARQRTLTDLKEVASGIRVELGALETLKAQKENIAEDVSDQEKELKRSANEAQAMVEDLEKKEKSLVRQLEKQRKESAALAAEIERIIAAEVKKSADNANLPAAPALKALAAEFSRNKGKLPWPVDQGVITSRFGNQPHPVVKSITVSNNGIDITTPPGASVRTIFGGKVVGRKFIPGFDHMVIIQHGTYYSVYSRLARVNVEINEEVSPRQVIGSLSGSAKESPRLHLEIWENKVQLDPEKWISR